MSSFLLLLLSLSLSQSVSLTFSEFSADSRSSRSSSCYLRQKISSLLFFFRLFVDGPPPHPPPSPLPPSPPDDDATAPANACTNKVDFPPLRKHRFRARRLILNTMKGWQGRV